MLTRLLVLLFILKLKFCRNENIAVYLRHKYDGTTLGIYRRLELSTKKWKKAQLDHEFLLYCKMNDVVPNFVKFKVYRSSLYNSDFYRNATRSLLDLEIESKLKAINRLGASVASLSSALYGSLSYVDTVYIKTLLNKNISKYVGDTSKVHERKLLKLGINQPKFVSPKDVIFNYSDHELSPKEEFLLSLGLDFCLPNFLPKFTRFFLPFEVFFNNIRSLPFHFNLGKTQQIIQNIAHKFYSSNKVNWFPFFKQDDYNILKRLSKKKNLVICRPDKGRGIVLLNHSDYIQKMEDILSDGSKFTFVGPPSYNTIFKTEDKINRTLKQFKDNSIITDDIYNSLYSSGSSYNILYGLPKVHKRDVPLRPILAAYNAPNFAIAKYLVPLLSDLASNQYTLNNSASFIPDILSQDSRLFMVSFDVQSLFTNVPLTETIDIIINRLFPSDTSLFHSFDKHNFRKLLELAVADTHFIFNGNVYKQIDGMAMGSPLGPTFANIFMCFLESLILDQCPDSFKPIFLEGMLTIRLYFLRKSPMPHCF